MAKIPLGTLCCPVINLSLALGFNMTFSLSATLQGGAGTGGVTEDKEIPRWNKPPKDSE